MFFFPYCTCTCFIITPHSQHGNRGWPEVSDSKHCRIIKASGLFYAPTNEQLRPDQSKRSLRCWLLLRVNSFVRSLCILIIHIIHKALQINVGRSRSVHTKDRREMLTITNVKRQGLKKTIKLRVWKWFRLEKVRFSSPNSSKNEFLTF